MRNWKRISVALLWLCLVVGAEAGGETPDRGGGLELAVDVPGAPEAEPWLWSRARFLTVDLAVDPVAAQEWLPPGITVADPPRATYYVVEYPDSSCCGPYDEAGIILYVVHDGEDRKHCPWILVTQDTALLKGRDFLGFPKKMGDIRISLDPLSREVNATVVRQGTTLLDIQGTVVGRNSDPPSVLGGEWANVWGVQPHPDLAGSLVALPRVLVVDFAERNLAVGDVAIDSLTVEGSPSDPIDEILTGAVLGARLHLVNFGLPTDPEPISRQEVPLSWFERTRALRYD